MCDQQSYAALSGLFSSISTPGPTDPITGIVNNADGKIVTGNLELPLTTDVNDLTLTPISYSNWCGQATSVTLDYSETDVLAVDGVTPGRTGDFEMTKIGFDQNDPTSSDTDFITIVMITSLDFEIHFKPYLVRHCHSF